MVREKLIANKTGMKDYFKWRSHEVMRIEAFSDAVFAFAVTLLIVSLEVPETFDQLLNTMSGFAAFAVSFTILFQIWYSQYMFFRRYGLEDKFTIFMSGVLLFLVLFYVYPLKFLFRLLFDMGQSHHSGAPSITQPQIPQLMIIYGAGFLLIYLVLMLMYYNAYKKRGELGLTEMEIFHTKSKMYAFSINIIVPLITIIVSLVIEPAKAGLAGFIYFLLGPIYSIFYSTRSRKYKKLFGA